MIGHEKKIGELLNDLTSDVTPAQVKKILSHLPYVYSGRNRFTPSACDERFCEAVVQRFFDNPGPLLSLFYGGLLVTQLAASLVAAVYLVTDALAQSYLWSATEVTSFVIMCAIPIGLCGMIGALVADILLLLAGMLIGTLNPWALYKRHRFNSAVAMLEQYVDDLDDINEGNYLVIVQSLLQQHDNANEQSMAYSLLLLLLVNQQHGDISTGNVFASVQQAHQLLQAKQITPEQALSYVRKRAAALPSTGTEDQVAIAVAAATSEPQTTNQSEVTATNSPAFFATELPAVTALSLPAIPDEEPVSSAEGSANESVDAPDRVASFA